MKDQPSTKEPKHYPEYAPGGYFDIQTYRGNIRGAVFSIVSTVLIWFFEDAYALAHQLFGSSHEINQAKQEWTRLCGVVLGALGLILGLIGLLQVFLKRRTARRISDNSN